ncbi:hypothetical protein MHYP_G00000690 [Metynnis hypsauchen]
MSLKVALEHELPHFGVMLVAVMLMEPLATSRPCLQVNYFNISGGYNLLTPTMPEHNVIALFNQLDSSWSSGSPRSPVDRNVKL